MSNRNHPTLATSVELEKDVTTGAYLFIGTKLTCECQSDDTQFGEHDTKYRAAVLWTLESQISIGTDHEWSKRSIRAVRAGEAAGYFLRKTLGVNPPELVSKEFPAGVIVVGTIITDNRGNPMIAPVMMRFQYLKRRVTEIEGVGV